MSLPSWKEQCHIYGAYYVSALCGYGRRRAGVPPYADLGNGSAAGGLSRRGDLSGRGLCHGIRAGSRACGDALFCPGLSGVHPELFGGGAGKGLPPAAGAIRNSLHGAGERAGVAGEPQPRGGLRLFRGRPFGLFPGDHVGRSRVAQGL